MSSYRDLEIYNLAYELALRVHKASLKMRNFELYEQGSQIRRSTKSIRDAIPEGYGRSDIKLNSSNILRMLRLLVMKLKTRQEELLTCILKYQNSRTSIMI